MLWLLKTAFVAPYLHNIYNLVAILKIKIYVCVHICMSISKYNNGIQYICDWSKTVFWIQALKPSLLASWKNESTTLYRGQPRNHTHLLNRCMRPRLSCTEHTVTPLPSLASHTILLHNRRTTILNNLTTRPQRNYSHIHCDIYTYYMAWVSLVCKTTQVSQDYLGCPSLRFVIVCKTTQVIVQWKLDYFKMSNTSDNFDFWKVLKLELWFDKILLSKLHYPLWKKPCMFYKFI